MPVALLALAAGAFCIGTTEFVIVGMLPEIGADLHVSIATAGLLISGYALSVVVGAPLITVIGARLPRKTMLVWLLVLFIVGNAICAIAPTYGILLTGRAVAALCHGAFFGIGSVVATSLTAPHRRASAIAMMFTGLTVANVLGVPLGTAVGQSFGWRTTFWVVTVLGIVAVACVLALVPGQPMAEPDVRGEMAVFRRPQVWLALLTTALGFAGVFASFTYIAPMMTGVAGFSDGAISWLLVLFGAGLCIGNVVGGRAADRALMPSLYVILGLLVAVLLTFVATAHARVPAAITILVFGAVGFATVPAMQMRIMDKAAGAPTLASAANIAAFNLGNALGAWLGGVAIDAHLGLVSPNWVGAALALSGLGVAVLSGVTDTVMRPAPLVPGPVAVGPGRGLGAGRGGRTEPTEARCAAGTSATDRPPLPTADR